MDFSVVLAQVFGILKIGLAVVAVLAVALSQTARMFLHTLREAKKRFPCPLTQRLRERRAERTRVGKKVCCRSRTQLTQGKPLVSRPNKRSTTHPARLSARRGPAPAVITA